jgi:MFS superfamily sulfate permease-like transporter
MALSRKRMEAWNRFRYEDRVPVNYCLVARYFVPLFGLRYIDFFKDAETQYYWQLQFAKYRIENIPEDFCTGAVLVVLLLRDNRYAPASIVLLVGGIIIMAVRGQLAQTSGISLSLPPLTMVDPREIWPVLKDAGLAQIPLTATNAVIATSALIVEYWPTRRVTNRQLAVNMGVMNVVLPFFGGMPLCHGAGGLAGQYYFGARTGGTSIIEGTIEIALGILLAGSIASIFAAFPLAIVGAMMLLVGVEMVKFVRDLQFDRHLIPVAATLAGSLLANMSVGFAVGIAVHYLLLGKEHRRADTQR